MRLSDDEQVQEIESLTEELSEIRESIDALRGGICRERDDIDSHIEALNGEYGKVLVVIGISIAVFIAWKSGFIQYISR